MAKFMAFAIGLGFALGEVGLLPKATKYMAELVIEAQPKMIRMSDFNRQLWSGGRVESKRSKISRQHQ